jgi:hypothetical protein
MGLPFRRVHFFVMELNGIEHRSLHLPVRVIRPSQMLAFGAAPAGRFSPAVAAVFLLI